MTERTDVGLYWSKTLYSFRFGPQNIGFPRAATKSVMPTHDLCHLFLGVGAAGTHYYWYPEGTDAEVRWSEAYCVALEMILFWSYNIAIDSLLGGVDPVATILDAVFRHMEHFVDVHYRPFPCSPGEFWRSFSLDIDPQIIAGYYLHYAKLRETEIRTMQTLDTAELSVEFDSAVDYECDTVLQKRGRELALMSLRALKYSRAPQKVQ
jgi:hypothetical protein